MATVKNIPINLQRQNTRSRRHDSLGFLFVQHTSVCYIISYFILRGDVLSESWSYVYYLNKNELECARPIMPKDLEGISTMGKNNIALDSFI